MICLFIGGPWDGEKRDVELYPYMKVPIHEKTPIHLCEKEYNLSFEIVIYNLQKVIYDELYFLEPKVHYVYVREGLNFGFG
jgi:hypothetical protein